jgi:DNA uptake protein ComE-like DNA-binding protein
MNGARRSRRFNFLTERCVRLVAVLTDNRALKRRERRAPFLSVCHVSCFTHPTDARRGPQHASASILVGVVWCIAILSIVVIGVLHTARLDLIVVKNYGDRIQARYLALAGVEKAKALLYQDSLDRKKAGKNHTGYLYDAPELFREVDLGPGKFSVFHGTTPDQPGDIAYGITDEESRLNLNQSQPQEFAKIYGVTPDTVAAITDWKDDDNNISPAGAEAEYYMSLKPPYLPRNGPFQTVRELLMVRGVSRDLLFADDAKQNGLLPSPSPRGEESGTRLNNKSSATRDPGLAGILTVDGWTQNVNAEGEDRVNVQTADETALSGIKGLSKEIARAIVAYRGQNRLENLAELLDVTAPQNRPGSRAGSGNPSSSGPKVINEDLFLEIADSVTTQNTRELPGLININTANAQVLTCLPGMSPELAQAVVSYRGSTSFFPNVAWLLKVPGMSRDIFKQLAGRVTARSETFRIVSEGRINSSGARQRIETIVHVGANSVQTLSYREDL